MARKKKSRVLYSNTRVDSLRINNIVELVVGEVRVDAKINYTSATVDRPYQHGSKNTTNNYHAFVVKNS